MYDSATNSEIRERRKELSKWGCKCSFNGLYEAETRAPVEINRGRWRGKESKRCSRRNQMSAWLPRCILPQPLFVSLPSPPAKVFHDKFSGLKASRRGEGRNTHIRRRGRPSPGGSHFYATRNLRTSQKYNSQTDGVLEGRPRGGL